MKNIHILPTENSSRLSYNKDGVLELHRLQWRKNTQHIYITNDEEIKDGDWAYHKTFGIGKITHIHGEYSFVSIKRNSTDGTITTPWKRNIPDIKKIILTTDQPSDSVQAIDDEFLKWFVKNPSCESVEVIYEPKNFLDTKQGWEYEIIIPKEEPKLTNVCIKCGVDLYYADNFACQEHPKNCKGIHLSEETLKERALKEETKQDKIMERFISNAKQQETLEEFIFKVPFDYNIKPKEVIDMCMKEQENIILTFRLGNFIDMINSLSDDTEKNRILKSVFNNRDGELLLESYKSMKSHYEK